MTKINLHEDEELNDLNLKKEMDKLIRMKIILDKSKIGCGRRFEYGDYINGEICVKGCLCEDCDRNIEENETEVSKQETLIIGINIAKNEDLISKIKEIINDSKYQRQNNEEKIFLIKELLNKF